MRTATVFAFLSYLAFAPGVSAKGGLRGLTELSSSMDSDSDSCYCSWANLVCCASEDSPQDETRGLVDAVVVAATVKDDSEDCVCSWLTPRCCMSDEGNTDEVVRELSASGAAVDGTRELANTAGTNEERKLDEGGDSCECHITPWCCDDADVV